jgi:hypothetical protein
MFKFIIGVVVIAWAASWLMDSNREAELQAQRTAEQSTLLVQMEQMHQLEVTTLVDEWRKAVASPSERQVAELRLIAERIKADPASAKRYTAEAKNAYQASLPFTPVVGGWSKSAPGLDGAVPAKVASTSN